VGGLARYGPTSAVPYSTRVVLNIERGWVDALVTLSRAFLNVGEHGVAHSFSYAAMTQFLLRRAIPLPVHSMYSDALVGVSRMTCYAMDSTITAD